MKIGEVQVGDQVTVTDSLDAMIYTVLALSDNGIGAHIAYQLHNGRMTKGSWVDVCYLMKPTKKQMKRETTV